MKKIVSLSVLARKCSDQTSCPTFLRDYLLLAIYEKEKCLILFEKDCILYCQLHSQISRNCKHLGNKELDRKEENILT